MYAAICEDQLSDLEALTKLLERWQQTRKTTLRFQVFRSALDLLDAVGKEHFTLYLLDVMMPMIDGIAKTSRI